MSVNMICNFKKCRKALSANAWVTSCSHAFCVEHGMKEFNKHSSDIFQCPACNSVLKDKFDIIQADLNPSEAFKSIVLAGMRPEMIMDIAMRAMSFWSYQIEQETRYQENISKHSRDRAQCIDEIHNLNMQKMKAELQTHKRKTEAMQKELSNKKKQTDELTAALEEKNRKIQKMNFQIESLKRKSLVINNEETQTGGKQNIANIVANRHQSPGEFVFEPARHLRKMFNLDRISSPNNIPKNNNSFMFKPAMSKKNNILMS